MSSVASNLAYVRLNQKWNYVWVFVDLYNRKIIGYSADPNKDKRLVYRVHTSFKTNLNQIQLFHTDRGNEFKNMLIKDALDTFKIKRFLSIKGCPYDNAAEATFKLFKTEFVKRRHFENLADLTRRLYDYIHWLIHIRIHRTLDYKSPIDCKIEHHNSIDNSAIHKNILNFCYNLLY